MNVRSAFFLGLAPAALLLASACTQMHGTPTDSGGVDASVDAATFDAPDGCAPAQLVCHAACTSVLSDDHNCGRCDNVCPAGVGCAGGSCSCLAPMTVCNGACVDTKMDAANCGSCGHACASTEQCAAGTCIPTCAAPSEVCLETRTTAPDGGVPDGGTGTTTIVPVCSDLQSDAMHCGRCGTQCRGGGLCTAGRCMCPAGTDACMGTCVDRMTSLDYCGDCTTSCGAGGTCAGGVCTMCGTARTTCAGSTRCIDTQTDVYNCGTCGHRCAVMERCTDGMCGCVAPRADCGMGCTDLTNDVANCGACGVNCGTGGACVAMHCTCGAGFAMCGAGCSDVTSDRNNCGSCGHACATGEVCVASGCTATPLYHGWPSPISGCTTTAYNTTAPTVLGGTYPFNTGDSNACRAWKLAATVCTTQPTMYLTDTNNWTCPVSGGFTDPAFGTYCRPTGTGAQYACSTCPGACNATCIYMPLSLRNCSGAEASQM